MKFGSVLTILLQEKRVSDDVVRSSTGGWAPNLAFPTQREAKVGMSATPTKPAPRPQAICRICGAPIARGRSYCTSCVTTVSKENLVAVAGSGRVAAQSPEAQARRSATKRRHDHSRQSWLASSQPAWLNNETYLQKIQQKIQPRLAGITYSTIASVLGVSEPYAADIRAGRRCPHPRHWQALASLVGIRS